MLASIPSFNGFFRQWRESVRIAPSLYPGSVLPEADLLEAGFQGRSRVWVATVGAGGFFARRAHLIACSEGSRTSYGNVGVTAKGIFSRADNSATGVVFINCTSSLQGLTFMRPPNGRAAI